MVKHSYIIVRYPSYDCYIRHDVLACSMAHKRTTFSQTLRHSDFVMNTTTGIPLKDRDGMGTLPKSMCVVSYSTLRESALKEDIQWTKFGEEELISILLMEEL